jgi:type IV secretory pathway TrbD component
MTKRATVLFTMAWVVLALTGVSILVFGLIATVWGGASDPPFLRALGIASMGMGLFGVMITVSLARADPQHRTLTAHTYGWIWTWVS